MSSMDVTDPRGDAGRSGWRGAGGLGAGAATGLVAQLTWRRMLRGRALRFSAAIAALPLLATALEVRHGGHGAGTWREMYAFAVFLLAVLPPMHLASAIGEEREEMTLSLLWSRPLPRWSVLTGKLVALVPLLSAILAASLTATFFLAWADTSEVAMLLVGIGAMALGTLAVGCQAMALGSLVPRHPLAIAIVFMLVIDLPIGLLPMALQQLSITHQVRVLARIDQYPDPWLPALLWLLGMAAVWLGIALVRIRRLE
jgi:ABC-2 type transport system permease protein